MIFHAKRVLQKKKLSDRLHSLDKMYKNRFEKQHGKEGSCQQIQHCNVSLHARSNRSRSRKK